MPISIYSYELYTILLMTLRLIPYITTMPSVQNVPKLNLPQSCYESGYCFEKHAMYPQGLVDQLVLKLLQMKMQNMTLELKRPELSKREYENDCEKSTQMDSIYEIVDENDNVRVVVQSEQNIKQIIQIEKCSKPGRILHPTVHFSEDIVSMFHLRCRQTSLDYQFLVLNLSWNGVEMVKSKHGVPVACDCVVVDD